MKRPPIDSLVRVEWEDCYSHDDWTHVEELLKRDVYRQVTVGWFLGVSKGKHWVVTTGLNEDRKIGGCTWFIPPSLVHGWTLLEEQKNPPSK